MSDFRTTRLAAPPGPPERDPGPKRDPVPKLKLRPARGPIAAPGSCPASNSESSQRRRKQLALFLLLVLVLAIGAAVWWWQAAQPDPDFERNIVVGSVSGGDAPQRDVDEGMIAFSIDTKMSFASPSEEGDILFENPEGNGKYIRLSLVRDDDGSELYSTGLLQPGTYVERDALDAMVSTGTYPCTALVSAYRTDDKSYIGTVAAGVTVTVGT